MPRAARGLAWVLAAALLAGCAGGERERARRLCPRVDIPEYANELVRFLPGPGRDVTDVVFRTRLMNYRGACEVVEDGNRVEVEIVVEFAVERGPANRDDRANFEYFVAIPQFHPRPAGKRRFAVAVGFEEGRNRALYRDEIAVAIPLEEGWASRDFDIFIGYQLTAAELDYNQRGVRDGARPGRGPR